MSDSAHDSIDTSGWSAEDQAAFEAERVKIAAEKDLVAAMVASESTPAAHLARAREEREQLELARQDLERAKMEDLVWHDLVKNHGRGRVARLDTKDGLVVLRVPTEAEAVDQGLRLANLTLVERTAASIEYMAKLVVYPAPVDGKPHPVRQIGQRWPGLWDELNELLGALASARADQRRPLG